MPELWWSSYSRRSNGYFGSETFRDSQGDITALNTWSRFLVKQFNDNNHEWHKFNIVTRWIASSQQTFLIIFESPKQLKLQKILRDKFPNPILIGSQNDTISDPFWVYLRLLEELCRLQDKTVWAVRDLVRNVEKEDLSKKPNPNYRSLHDTARHAIHVSETLEVAEKSVAHIIQQHSSFEAESACGNKAAKAKYRHVGERLLWYDHMLQSLQCRASANKERLLNEIQLAFNSVAQYDSRISVKIGQATQSDSAAMKTIAFVTLTFLPATFISALFSMSFFKMDDNTGAWSVSEKFWLYWVIAIPVTILTGGSWLLWQKWNPTPRIGEEGQSVGKFEELARMMKHGTRIEDMA
ncbi:hypothetical protein NW762_003607 [Fusarium torreyae]|uniref:Mg2+ transporter protein, CorA-like/Zinc transport protein ZntB n=1 Tax=Fusarium torreyae TaxID=1237075 RepID=A0A9W8VL76_9HYPO|nr:hypothetical protein NW762_003607 [Fusarium torreyae]